MLSSGTTCYHLGWNVIIWDAMLSSGTKCYYLEWNVIIWDEMLSSGANVIIWDKMLSSGMKCYHLGWNVIIWDAMLSSGANVIIWDQMLSSKANVIMVLSGANVIIWCYHVMLSSGMITPPFLFFLETSRTLVACTISVSCFWLCSFFFGGKCSNSWILNEIGRNFLLVHRKKKLRTFTCRSTYFPLWLEVMGG